MSIESCRTCGWAVAIHDLGECPVPHLGICKMCGKRPRTHVGADFCGKCLSEQSAIVPDFYGQVAEKRPMIWVGLDDLRCLLDNYTEPDMPCDCDACEAEKKAMARIRQAVDNWRHPFDCGVEGCAHRNVRMHMHAGGMTMGPL